MRKVKTNRRNRIFGLFAMFAMAIGVGVALAPKEVIRTEAVTVSTKVVLADPGSDSSNAFDATTIHSEDNSLKDSLNGDFITSTVSTNKVYAGNGGFKYGSSTAVGKWRFKTSETVTKVEAVFKTYGSDTSQGNITSHESPSKTIKSDNLTSTPSILVLESTNSDEFSIDITGKRGYLVSIEFYYEASGPVKTLDSIAVTKQPTKKSYDTGETFDKTGMEVTATYSDSSTLDVTDYVIVTPDPLTEGLTSVTVSYTEGGITETATVSGLTVTTPSYSSVKYEVTSHNNLSISGVAPEGSGANLVETYGTSTQITSGNSQTLTLTGYTNVRIIEITMSMKSNSKAGAGSFKYSVNVGATYHNIVADAAFNNAAWNGAYSSSYVDVTKTVDIAVQSDIEFIVAATTNSLYVQSYEFKWEQEEAAVLTGLTMNKPTVSIVEEETEQLSVTPVPELAPYDVTWTSSNPAAATVDQNGLVTAVAAGKGTATITATDKTNNTIKAESMVTVLPMPDYDFFEKITNASKLHFGATYVIANEDGTKAMSNVSASNNIPAQDTILKNGEIRGQDVLMKVVLEVGLVKGTYALKTVSTHGESDGKYIYAAGASSNNYLRLEDNITVNSSWLITFEEGVASLVAQNDQSRNVMRFNSDNSPNIFNAYSSGMDNVALFLHQDSVDPTVEAQAFVDAALNGPGEESQAYGCNDAFEFLDDVLNRLSDDALLLLLDSENPDFVEAVNRYDYLDAWNTANPESGAPGGVIALNNENNPINATLIIGLLGLTTMAGYYFLTKKEKLVK